jgi:hypothetical protein
MVVPISELKNLVERPLSKDSIDEAKKLSKKLNLHVNGIGVGEYLKKIENFEDDEHFLRRKQNTNSQEYVFQPVIRIINKIFSAKGGSNYYTFKKKDSEKELDLISKLKDIKGVPIRKWIQNFGLNKYLVDPNGIFLIENKKVGNEVICYPTYKSVDYIWDFQRNGRMLEYVLFKLPEQEVNGEKLVVYRLYDDEKDLFFTIKSEDVLVIDEYKNPWKYVPGILIGDFPNNEFDIFDSRFSVSMELADKRLMTESIKNAYEHYHGFPLTWQILTKKCKTCNGTGTKVLGNGNGEHICTSCYGSGWDLNKDVSKIIGIVPPSDSDEPKIVPDVGGYVQPDLETWREYRAELDWLEKNIQYVLLGSYTREKKDRETATSRFIDVQPINDTLHEYADWAERTEKYLTDIMGKFYFKNDFEGSSINYGRRYLIEGADELWKVYEQARKLGAPTEKLDNDIIEYYETKYANDVKTLQIQKNLFYANPYRHVTITEAKNSLPQAEYLKRVLYDMWIVEVDQATILQNKPNELRIMFETWASSKIKQDKLFENESTKV